MSIYLKTNNRRARAAVASLRSCFSLFAFLMCSTALADWSSRPQKGHLDEIPPEYVPSAAAERYDEILNYNAYVRKSYVPGFIPKTSSLFENPREYTAAVGKLADPYLYSRINGWFYLSPNGYQSSVPPQSAAHDYVTGKMGITSSLQYGYPRGMRVIEEVVIPYAASAERGGFYISAEVPASANVAPLVTYPVTQTVRQKDSDVTETQPPASMAAPAPAGTLADEVSDK